MVVVYESGMVSVLIRQYPRILPVFLFTPRNVFFSSIKYNHTTSNMLYIYNNQSKVPLE